MRRIGFLTIVLLVSFVALGIMVPLNMVSADRLPGSLDAFFPPRAEQPVYLFRMLGLGSLFSGIPSFIVENDLQGATDVFEKFKAEYVAISELVPEWKKEYPVEPLEELGTALKAGDRQKAMEAQGKVGNVCHECHVLYMPMAQQKYHWGDFNAIKVKDPLSNEEVTFRRLKQYLDSNFAGIGLNIEGRQREKARKQVQGFNARFQALKTTCGSCHIRERNYYTDENVQGLIDKLGQAIENPSADPKVAGDLVQRIGMESCFRCHLIHIPAAYAKDRDQSN